VCLLDEWISSQGPFEASLDAPIFVSGGERNRLTLAYHIHLALVNQARVLILDECEQGTDLFDANRRRDAYRLVDNIRRALPDKTLVFVSHLYNHNGAPLVPGAQSVPWTHVLSLENMLITV
jgi:ABC-type transport system involved in cytochrome bd biosynthesis fused ATPase/permease subunit